MTREQKQTDGHKAFMVLALLIIGGLIFAAGIIVGQRLVPCPEPASADPLKQLDKISARPPVDSRVLSFPEALNGPRPKPPRRPEVTPTASLTENTVEGNVRSATADKREKSAPTDTGQPGAESQSEKEKPESLKRSQQDAKSTSSANAGGRYCMQVASYHERAQAQALLNRLRKRGYSDVRVVEGTASEKGVVYRVRAGHFISRGDAERQKEKIVREENLSVLIVTEE